MLARLSALLNRKLDALLASAQSRVSTRVERARTRRVREMGVLASSARILPEARIQNFRERAEFLHIGEHTAVRGEIVILEPRGHVRIGDYGYIGAGTRIWSTAGITIGERVLIAHDCEIHDGNSHSLDAGRRHQHYREILTTGHPRELDDITSAPIIIADDVWIGFGSTILKGVTIGDGSVVAARSLVTKSVPPNVLVAGSPARVVRNLAPSSSAASTSSNPGSGFS